MSTNPGFDQPRPSSDAAVVALYQEHNLGDTPTLREIEPIATALLGSVPTIIPGAELVLGRYVGAEDLVLKDIMRPDLTGEDRFALLLLQTAFTQVEMSPEEKRAAAILKATSWVSERRPDLVPFIREYGIFSAYPKDEKFYVGGAINGPKGYEYFSFWVDLANETIEEVTK